jgi:hypothetical protein
MPLARQPVASDEQSHAPSASDHEPSASPTPFSSALVFVSQAQCPSFTHSSSESMFSQISGGGGDGDGTDGGDDGGVDGGDAGGVDGGVDGENARWHREEESHPSWAVSHVPSPTFDMHLPPSSNVALPFSSSSSHWQQPIAEHSCLPNPLPSHASSPLRSSAGARLSHTQIGVAMHVDSSPTDSQRVEHVSDVLSQSQSILSLHLLFFPSRASQAGGGADGGVYGGSEGGADGGAFGSGGGVDGGADGPTGRHFPPNPKDAKE